MWISPFMYQVIPTVARRTQRAANTKNTCKLRKQLSSILQRTCCKCSKHNQTKKNALQIKCIWLCCEHLHHLLSNWWRCFLDLLVIFLFACVFWSCSALSSLGHRLFHYYKHVYACVKRPAWEEDVQTYILYWNYTSCCNIRQQIYDGASSVNGGLYKRHVKGCVEENWDITILLISYPVVSERRT